MWISVEDRLPQLGSQVLVYDLDYGLIVANYEPRGGKPPKFRDTQEQGELYCVTHWMPITPPQTTQVKSTGTPACLGGLFE